MDRYLKPVDVWAIAFGCIVGWGAFVMPGTTFIPIAGPGGMALGMALCTAVMLVVGRNFAYLMQHRPGTGGVYAYTKEAFGRDHAFLCSWFLVLSYLTIVFLNATAIFVLTRTLFGDALQVGFRYQVAGADVYLSEIALSTAILAATALLFILHKPLLQKIQTALAIVLLAGVAVIAAACLPGMDPSSLLDAPYTGPGQAAGILTIVLLAPWAFVGFDIASLETAHFDFPENRPWVPVALAILAGGFVYIAMGLVSVSALPAGLDGWQDYLQALGALQGIEATPTFFASLSALGPAGGPVIGITALAAILTGIIGASRGTIRLLSTMAEDQIISREFLGTTFCILFIMAISIAASFLGRNALEWFVELTSFGATIAFAYASAATWKLAAREGDAGARAMGIAGTAISAVLALVQLVSQLGPIETMGAPSFLLLAVWCLLGFLFYWRTMRQSDLADFDGASTSSTVLFCLLLYSAILWFVKTLTSDLAGLAQAESVARDGAVLVAIALAGLAAMLYVQRMLQRRQEALRLDVIRAEESSKAKSQFLFNMSHDIRTPMNAILGYTRLLEQEPDLPAASREHVGKIDTAGHSLLGIIDDILEMSRIESGKVELAPAPCDLARVLRDVTDLFGPQMREKDIALRVDAGKMRDTWAMCDENRLNRILHNLLSNAVKFTPEGGTVSVVLWQIAGDEPGRATYELRVKDDGIGMNPEFAARVFDAFERERTSTDSGIQGTGLGMAITKRIVDEMGGTIEVNTAPGRGTEFVVRFALDLAKPPEDEQAGYAPEDADGDARGDAASLSGRHVLVVEDNPINREIVMMMLQAEGIGADVAENGAQAVEMVEAGAGFDAVLMDIQMPVMDGYEATRRIRALPDERAARVPIVAVTANAFGEDIQRAHEAGMDAHVAKPIDPDTLFATLANVLQD